MSGGSGEFAFWCLYLDALERASIEQVDGGLVAELHHDAPHLPVCKDADRCPNSWWRQRKAGKIKKEDFLVG